MRKPSLAVVLKGEIRRHASREALKTRQRLRNLQKAVTLLRREVRKDHTLIGRLRARLGKVRATGTGRATRRKGDGPGRRTSPHTIRALRERMGLSRLQFAKLLGVSPGSIFGWETGRTLPRGKNLDRISEARKLGPRSALARVAGSGPRGRKGRRRSRRRR